jgi:O-antigen/teichoic acid export membrane protein
LRIPQKDLEQASALFYLSAIGFIGSILMMWGKAVFNGLHRYEISNSISVLNNLLSISIGILFINSGYGIVAFFATRVAGFLTASFVYVLLISRKMETFKLLPIVESNTWRELRKQVGYGFSLRISGLVFSRMDQVLIGAWVGVAAVATYSFPFLMATTISGLIANATHFTFPLVSSLTASNSRDLIVSFFFRIIKLIASAATMIFLPLIIFGDTLLGLWINPTIAGENRIVLPAMMLAFYANVLLATGLTAFVVGKGELRYYTFYGVSRAVLLLLGFLLLIKIFGIDGAAYSYLVAVLLDIFFAVRTMRGKFDLRLSEVVGRAYMKPILLGIVLCVPLAFLRDRVDSWISLILTVGAFELLYLSMGYWIGIPDASEKQAIHSFLKKMRLTRDR